MPRYMWQGKRQIEVEITSTQTSVYNVFTNAGSPTDPVLVILTIDAGVVLEKGLVSGTGWNSASLLRLIVHGRSVGTGGDAGQGATVNVGTNPLPAGHDGDPGGAAIELNVNAEIDNTDGFILGGGGGGGGGGCVAAVVPPSSGTARAGGGGGGAGQGYFDGTHPRKGAGGGSGGAGTDGSDGIDGSDTSAGNGGNGNTTFGGMTSGKGGKGGTWGQPGNAGQPGAGVQVSLGGAGGAAGPAVKTNGFSLVWLGGNNSTQVHGPIT